jgi:hypothetical protein
MKKILLSLSFIAVALAGKAQNCSDLIISEYVEGTGNNKALEVYNTSSSPISLANYRILRHDNGNTSFTAIEGEMQLPTNITLAPYKAYVIALNLTDPAGTGQAVPIDPALQAAADTLLCPGCATGTGNSRVMCFNGDDALALQKKVAGVWTDVDIFACRGEQPTNSSGTASPTAGWTSLAPYASMPAGYTTAQFGPYFKQYWTQDKTMKRKASVKTGVSTNPAFNSFNPSVQWDSLAVNTFTNLGSHACDCQVVGVKELNKSFAVNVFPNPAKSTVVLQSVNAISKVMIYSVTGQVVKTITSNTTISGEVINVSDLTQGVYFISLSDDKNNQTIKKLIIE